MGESANERLPKIWEKVMKSAETDLGEEAVRKWLKPIRLSELRGDVAVLTAPSTFHSNWVEREYGLNILRFIQAHVDATRRITISADTRVERSHGAKRPAASAGLLSDPASLNARFTFENFIVGKPNELAYAAARRVAESADTLFNPVFLYGNVGLGKTHLMHAVAHHVHATRPDCRVCYLSAEQFMYRFVQALTSKSTFAFKQQFRTVDMLMIDDVQFIAGKENTQEEFFHTFNALIDNKKQIVLSADRSPDQIDGLQNRITSRLQGGLTIDIHPTDYELRLAILQSKAEAIRDGDDSITIERSVLEFLAHRISSNVRVLEGALTRVFAFATLVGRPIDLDMTKECLADLLREADRRISIWEIKRRVADFYHLRTTELDSPRRARAVARPRQVAMFLCKALTSKSLPEIGRGFGNRDHTTVIHAVRRIEELRVTDSQLDADIETLRRSIEGG